MVTYDEFNTFKTENAAQHTELRERLERLTTEVAVLSERINALQSSHDLTKRLMIAVLGTMGATFAAVVYAFITRQV